MEPNPTADAENDKMYRYNIANGETISEAVIQAITDISGEDTAESIVPSLESQVSELEPLYHSIDCEALDQLFQPTNGGRRRSEGVVSFVYDQYRVTVEKRDSVIVRPNRSSSNRC